MNPTAHQPMWDLLLCWPSLLGHSTINISNLNKYLSCPLHTFNFLQPFKQLASPIPPFFKSLHQWGYAKYFDVLIQTQTAIIWTLLDTHSAIWHGSSSFALLGKTICISTPNPSQDISSVNISTSSPSPIYPQENCQLVQHLAYTFNTSKQLTSVTQ